MIIIFTYLPINLQSIINDNIVGFSSVILDFKSTFSSFLIFVNVMSSYFWKKFLDSFVFIWAINVDSP